MTYDVVVVGAGTAGRCPFVDGRGAVHGVNGLWVADASVIPVIRRRAPT